MVDIYTIRSYKDGAVLRLYANDKIMEDLFNTTTPHRYLVCGDRDWRDGLAIREVLRYIKHVAVIEGGCRGADLLARIAAEEIGLEFEEFPANWSKLGKRAGPTRNQAMLDQGQPNRVLAFHDNIGNSTGTKDMLERARAAKLPCWVFSHYHDRNVPDGINLSITEYKSVKHNLGVF